MGRLTTLKPRITTTPGRLQVLRSRPDTVERKRGSAGVKDRHTIREKYCDICQVCGRLGRIVDHIIPLWEGGSDDEDNKQTICPPCHEAKSAEEARRRAGK
jgi:5-methylcytosine-specific restriction protein A